MNGSFNLTMNAVPIYDQDSRQLAPQHVVVKEAHEDEEEEEKGSRKLNIKNRAIVELLP